MKNKFIFLAICLSSLAINGSTNVHRLIPANSDIKDLLKFNLITELGKAPSNHTFLESFIKGPRSTTFYWRPFGFDQYNYYIMARLAKESSLEYIPQFLSILTDTEKPLRDLLKEEEAINFKLLKDTSKLSVETNKAIMAKRVRYAQNISQQVGRSQKKFDLAHIEDVQRADIDNCHALESKTMKSDFYILSNLGLTPSIPESLSRFVVV